MTDENKRTGKGVAMETIKRLRHMYDAAHADANRTIELQRVEIERLRAEVALWQDRFETERHDHEATMKHADQINDE